MNKVKMFQKINKEFSREFSDGVVDIRDCEWGDYPYVLHFTDDNPEQDVIDKAEQIANHFIPSVWFRDKARIVR